MSKYFITGVAGFVGGWFTDFLREKEPNADILGVDVAEGMEQSVRYLQMDLNDSQTLKSLIKEENPDYILHLASISSVKQSWDDAAGCFKNNTGIMLNILDAVAENKLRTKILAVGSSEEYGVYPDESMPLLEDMPLNPQNPYAAAKAGQEMLCRVYAAGCNVDVVMTRSFNHIGPRQSERFVIPSFIKQLVDISRRNEKILKVGNITVSRDFLDVRDVVAAYYLLLHRGKTGEVYNVCSGRSYKLRDVITEAEKILQIQVDIQIDESRLRPNDVNLIYGNNEKLRQLGWQQQYSFAQTIRDIIDFYKK